MYKRQAWDDEALEVYQIALPGYEVIGFTGTWESTDALHCRVKGIPDLEMLQLFHMPLPDTVSANDNQGYDLELVVDDLSGAGIIDDSVKVFWKNDNMQDYNVNSLYRSDIPEEINTYRGFIPVQAFGTIINYFLRSADSSGRVESNPIAGYHYFYAVPTDACNNWEIGDMDNSGQLDIYDILILADLIVYNNNLGVCCEAVADINTDGELSIIDIVTLVSLVASQ